MLPGKLGCPPSVSSTGSSSSSSSKDSNALKNSKALFQAATYFSVDVLPAQPSWQAALAALQAAIAAVAAGNLAGTFPASNNLSSGVLRWEVPVPRGSPAGLSHSSTPGFTALQWLQGQEGLGEPCTRYTSAGGTARRRTLQGPRSGSSGGGLVCCGRPRRRLVVGRGRTGGF